MKKIGFLAYPFENMKPEKDTTLHLMKGALENSHQVFLFESESMESIDSEVFALCTEIVDAKKPKKKNRTINMSLCDFDQIWIRKDPPFDRAYSYATLLLDYLPKSVEIVNSPASLRNLNEKLSLGFFKDYGPKTMISQNLENMKNFISKFQRVTLKPIDGFGGKGISFTHKNDEELEIKLRRSTDEFTKKIVLQEYIPEAKDGDKRVLIWNGKVLGGILRLHPEDSEINNLDAGGKAIATDLSPVQSEVSNILAVELKKQGVLFSGIDFLGDKLTEINVTSPTGLQELGRFSGVDHHINIFSDL